MGLIVDFYRGRQDFTRGGVSSRYDSGVVVNIPGPVSGAVDGLATLYLTTGGMDNPVLVPVRYEADAPVPDGWIVDRPEGAVGPMMGGNFAATSDSRFFEAVERLCGYRYVGALPVHDRFETPAQYEQLSR
jgi:hypothetical protein